MNHCDYRVLGITDSTLKTTFEEVVLFECSKVEYENSDPYKTLRYRFDPTSMDNFILPKDPKFIEWLEKAGSNEEIVSINLDDYELRKEKFNGEIKNNYYHKNLQISKQTIKPTKGIGNIIFGLDSDEIKNLLGSPNDSKKIENSRQEIHTWTYEELGLKLSFSSDHNYFLERIQIFKKGYLLFGNDFIGAEIKEIIDNKFSYNLSDLEYRTNKSDSKSIYSSVEKKLVFEVLNNQVESIYVLPIMKNDGYKLEIIWPVPTDHKQIVFPKEIS